MSVDASDVNDVRLWLRERLYQVSAVRGCVTNRPEADLVVRTWIGKYIFIYLIAEPPKVRSLQKLVRTATENSAACLFIVDAGLLPADSQRTAPKDWMLALHSLTDGRIYVYNVEADAPRIREMHFEQIANTDEQEAWYGAAIAIERLPIYPIWVRSGAMKGNWLIAHFDTDAFWQKSDYRQARTRFRHDQRSTPPRQREEQGQGDASKRRYYTDSGWQASGADRFSFVPSTPRTRLDDCCALLGVDKIASEEQVKTAFRKKALEFHPDTSELPKAEAEEKFRQINEAYAYIRDYKGW